MHETTWKKGKQHILVILLRSFHGVWKTQSTSMFWQEFLSSIQNVNWIYPPFLIIFIPNAECSVTMFGHFFCRYVGCFQLSPFFGQWHCNISSMVQVEKPWTERSSWTFSKAGWDGGLPREGPQTWLAGKCSMKMEVSTGNPWKSCRSMGDCCSIRLVTRG